MKVEPKSGREGREMTSPSALDVEFLAEMRDRHVGRCESCNLDGQTCGTTLGALRRTALDHWCALGELVVDAECALEPG